MVYSYLLGRADARAGDLARHADRLTVSLQACEAVFDALTIK
ncbi:DUF2514 family protein [Pseudomonas tremae]|nr:DUF2514 family protein [Pseudomonas tremae]UQB29921.1 DUF2514 family protein [Pseudomonas tremae]